jgi:hypothetical protein
LLDRDIGLHRQFGDTHWRSRPATSELINAGEQFNRIMLRCASGHGEGTQNAPCKSTYRPADRGCRRNWS